MKIAITPWLIIIGLLSGCATTRTTLSPESEARWQLRQVALNDLRNWEFNGRIAVQREEDGWFASLRWKQHGPAYQIQISGPAGQGTARLEGNDNGVTLTQSDQTIYRASRPEELLTAHLGWQVPVTGLHYWIRGLPIPKKLDAYELDATGRLIRLRQDNCDIHFDRYRIMGLMELPGSVILECPPLTVRIIIENWRVNLSNN